MRKLFTLVILLHSTFFSYSQNIIWSNDFSNCDDWIIGNAYDEGFTQYDPEVNFTCGTQAPVYNEPPFLSTTNENGFMTVNSNNAVMSDLSGPVDNCWIQTAEPIDISGQDDISLRFQTHYKNQVSSIFQGPNSPRLLVEISTDGITWPDIQNTTIAAASEGTRYHLWSPFTTPQVFLANSKEEVFILSELASQEGVDQIWLRFRWVGTFDMEWKIDDVQIVENPQHDLAITNAWLNTIFETYEYGAVPVGFADASNPVYLYVAVRNYSNSFQNAEVTLTLGGQSFTGSRLLGPGVVDSVYIENVIYPQIPGVYEATFTLANDDNPEENVFTKSLEISTSIYRQTISDDLFEITLGPDSDLAASAIYGDYLAGSDSYVYTCFGLKVLFGPNTEVGAQVYAELFSYDDDDPIEAVSQVFTITNEIYSEILDGQYVFIPFEESAVIQLDEYYLAKVSKVIGSETVSFYVDTKSDDFGGLIADVEYNAFLYTPNLIIEELYLHAPAVDLVLEIAGCMDIDACNYNPAVTIDSGNCIYPINSFVDCNGNCLNDNNSNGICDEFDFEGCTDITACNYNAAATIEDGTCTYPASEILDCNGECLNDINYNGICDQLEVFGCDDPVACNYQNSVTYNDGSCIYPLNIYVDCNGTCINDVDGNGICDEFDIEGCTDITACNYSPSATIEDGTCTYPASEILNCNGQCLNDINYNDVCDPLEIFGCNDLSACNYQSDVTVNNGSCIYEYDLSIVAFNDLNEDGVYDPSSEPTVPNAGYFQIYPGGITVYVGSDGTAQVPVLPSGTYAMTFFNGTSGLLNSIPISNLMITIPTCTTLEVPMTNNDGCSAYFEVINGNEEILHCQDGVFPIFRVFNLNEGLLDANITISFDPSLNFDATNTDFSSFPLSEEQYAISSPQPGLLVWQLSQIPSNFDAYFGVHILGPGVDFIGQTYNFDYTVSISCGGNPVYETAWTSNMEVTCAYDPNDIQGNPEGYTENHFILSDTEIEYRIRFQNTGNAPALDVVIENLIDTERLDISTFQPTGSSHAMSAILEPNGLAKFIFNGIMLPDSSANLQASMGYLTYKIRTLPGISVGEVINNSAAIFFDQNPPIYTNTAYHEIYSCDEIPQVDESYALCFGDLFTYDVSYPYLESTEWFINNQQISIEPNVEIPIVFEENLNIQLVMTNPLCEVTSQWNIEELPIPSSEILYNEATNELIAGDGVAWQWYTTEGIIPGATEQSFGLENQGSYYAIITNGEGCITESEVFNFVGISETERIILSVYPNPAEDELRLTVTSELVGKRYFINDITGRVVGEGMITAPSIVLDISNQSSGSYIFRVEGANVRFLKK